MKILLIEDEHYAVKHLSNLITKEFPDAKIVDVLDTVRDSIKWLSNHEEPDLIFIDIQLADGLSFQIFDKVKVNCPIIFTTAYDQYALNAFKVNSIDYLLKPIDKKSFKKATDKYKHFFLTLQSNNVNWNEIMSNFVKAKDRYKKRFLIKSGNTFGYLNAEDIAIFYSEDGLSFALNKESKKFLIDNSLENINESLDSRYFFKISRKHIVNLSAIIKVHPYLNQRLKIEVSLKTNEKLVVSRDKSAEFKKWLDN